MTEQHDNTSNTGPASTDSAETPPAGVTTLENGPQSLVEARDRYRGERDSAREERDALAGRVERMRRSEIERLAAAAGLSVGGDLFINDNSVEDYLTEDGDVDADKVAADVDAVLAERPGLGKRAPAFDPSHGLGGKPPAHKPEPSLSALIKDTVAAANAPFGVRRG